MSIPDRAAPEYTPTPDTTEPESAPSVPDTFEPEDAPRIPELEVDETIPPRPEEAAADVARAEPVVDAPADDSSPE